MKKMLAILLLLTHLSNIPFSFVNNKTSGGSLDLNFLEKMHATFQCDTFFETGTYNGKTTKIAASVFKKVYTVELHKDLFQESQSYLSNTENVTLYHGASASTIETVAPTINGKILFWLDAHYSGEGTAMSNNNPYSPEAITPICQELKAIKKSSISDCVILIDDIRGFGSEINDVEFLGCWAYPSIQTVCRLGKKINSNFAFALLGDTLLMYDATQHSPQLSDVVKACTESRLYDGKNCTDIELLEHEQIIMNAQGDERAFITELYKRMTDYKDPLFHHDLWYGLTSMGAQQWQEALLALNKVPHRIEYFSKEKQAVSRPIQYDHWRIKHYIEQIENRAS